MLFGLIATVMITGLSFGQDKFIEENLLDVLQANESNVKVNCKKLNVGINIGIAWVETEVYIAYRLPVGMGAGGGTIMIVDEEFCKTIGQASKYNPSMELNIKNLVTDVDFSNIDFIDIKKSSTWIDEEDGSKSTIRLSKYIVDKEGNIEIDLLTIE